MTQSDYQHGLCIGFLAIQDSFDASLARVRGYASLGCDDKAYYDTRRLHNLGLALESVRRVHAESLGFSADPFDEYEHA